METVQISKNGGSTFISVVPYVSMERLSVVTHSQMPCLETPAVVTEPHCGINIHCIMQRLWTGGINFRAHACCILTPNGGGST